MFLLGAATFILIISFILALRALKELSVPHEVSRMIGRKKTTGVILFLREKIVHYVN